METTLRKIKECRPCKDGWKKLLSNVNNDLDAKLTIKQILDSNGIEDAIWALKAINDQENIRLFACDVAESVLHIYEERYPDDKRPREAIEASKRFANNEITKKELQIIENNAYEASKDAADAATFNAANAADAVADVVAYDAIVNATYTAADAVADAADAAARKKQWDKIEKLLLKYL